MLNDYVISTVLMTDEAHFHLSGYVNREKCRYWAPENPREFHRRHLHGERFTGWCGITSFGVLVFEDNKSAAVTVTSEWALCGNATQLQWTSVTLSWDRSLISIASARWRNSSHRKGINECCAGNVNTTRHFPWRQCSMAGTFPCSLRLWLLFMGVSQKQSFLL